MLKFWHGKKVLITGHTGFKGAWLCIILGMSGAKITGYSLPPPTQPNLFGIAGCEKFLLSSISGDIRDYGSLRAAYDTAKPDFVFHMAAQSLVLESYRNPLYTYSTNVMGTVNILECARILGTKSFVNITTDKVYKNLEQEKGYRETDELLGFDPYSNSKSCSELITASYINSFFNNSGIPVSSARAGNVIGGGDFADNRLIPDCAKAAASNLAPVIRNPKSVRPFQHVLDVLAGYLLIAEKQYTDASLAGSYNIGPDENSCLTAKETSDIFGEFWNINSEPHRDFSVVKRGQELTGYSSPPSQKLHESGILRLNTEKIRKSLNWKPKITARKAIEYSAQWYKAYYRGNDTEKIITSQIEEFF